MSKALSITAMVFTILLSFLRDWGYALLRREWAEQPGSGFSVPDVLRIMLIGEIVANIAFILAMFGLAWLVLSGFEKDTLIAWIFILVGIIGMLYLPLVLAGPQGLQEFLTSSGFGVATRGFRMTLMGRGFGTNFLGWRARGFSW
jgi:hypothetical protein